MTYSDRTEEIVDNLTLFDDDLMSLVFDNNIEAANLLLRIILEKDDIDVIEVISQKELENPIIGGRNIRLDIFATDSTGKYYNIEVQRANSGAHIRRSRFHSGIIDSRTIEETGEPVNDGSHIIYVNGTYTGNDMLGKLMRDFACKNTDDIYYEELKKSIKHFKEKGGRKVMCNVVKEYGDERAKASAFQTKIDNIKNLMETLQFSLDQAMQALKISSDEQQLIRTIIK